MDSFTNAIVLIDAVCDDTVGELLRETSFTSEGMGAYSNFNLRPGWERCDADQLTKEQVETLIGPDYNETEKARIAVYKHTNTNSLVAWYWDGDGTLMYVVGQTVLFNTDCKKSYGWTRGVFN